MSEIKVNSIKGVGASAAAITVNNSDGTATANLTTVNSVTMPNGGFLSNRNLIINGAMTIAQRGTSSTSSGYQTVDRYQTAFDSGLTEVPTLSQATLSSSDTPYSLGFRHAFRITNGNQTSQTANDYIHLSHSIESQDVAKSGWNYTSASSYITLSFWVKVSTAQTMYVKVGDSDAGRTFTFAFAATTSWTRIIKTIPGNSNLVFNNDNGVGLQIVWVPYYGTSYTTSSHTNDAWNSNDGADQLPDMANTWFSANDATFDITGVQLEVGSVATDFEHRSFGQELALCQRYYYKQASTFYGFFGYGTNSGTNQMGNLIRPVDMRANPTITYTTGGYWSAGPYAGGNGGYYSYVYGQTTSSNGPNLSNYQLDAEL